ncbi:unnamed protein product [Effrenium voratum]|uniref:Uncharacterized protein n=1 Tax=Effrenium voratum TaxID=2562239 RepID=A0AA36NJJ5_9DINO|nr:unnamed protein product [Effrenium voratum]
MAKRLALCGVFCFAAANRPVVLVPGLTGSGLEVKQHAAAMPHWYCKKDTHDKWMKAWVDPVQALPGEVDCLIARLTLTYDAASDTYSNLANVELRALGWANGTGASGLTTVNSSYVNESYVNSVNSAHGLDLLYSYEFGPMLKKLESRGYALGKDVFLAPYDWRLAGDAHAQRKNGVGGYYQQLQQLIEEIVEASGQPAVVLSHSLGCPTMLHFFHLYVSEAWRARHIHGWLALSGPWTGGASQVMAYLGGWTLGLPSWLVPHDYVRPVQVNASSGVWMTPHPKGFGNRTLVVTPSRNYTAADMPDMVKLIGGEGWGRQTGSLFSKLQPSLAEIQSPPSGMHMESWYSTGVPTIEGLVYDTDLSEGFNQAPSKTIRGEGDGLVNLVSLSQVEKVWPSSTTTRVFANCSHFGILSDPRVLEALVEYLSEKPAPVFV